jgi:insulysin
LFTECLVSRASYLQDVEDTNFFFSADVAGMEGALDRFAQASAESASFAHSDGIHRIRRIVCLQFFISPLFNSSSTTLEMHAVDSEHRKNLQSDSWRAFQMLKHVSSASTPFHAFATGDMSSLNKSGTRAVLLAFHAAHYTAQRMRLTVVSKHSVSEVRIPIYCCCV